MLGKGIHKAMEESEQRRNLLYSIAIFTETIMHLVYPPKLGINIVFDFS